MGLRGVTRISVRIMWKVNLIGLTKLKIQQKVRVIYGMIESISESGRNIIVDICFVLTHNAPNF